MAELILASGYIPDNHLRSFGQVLGFEDQIILDAIQIGQDLPDIWTPLGLPRNRADYEDGIVEANAHTEAQAAMLAEYLGDKGFDAKNDVAIVLTDKEDPGGKPAHAPLEGSVHGTHFSKGDTIKYVTPSFAYHAHVQRVMHGIGKEPGYLALPEGRAPIGKQWSYRGHDADNYQPHAYNDADGRGRTIIWFGHSVVAQTTVTEQIKYNNAEAPKLIGRVSTYETARYTPELTPEQVARQNDIQARRDRAADDLYHNDPSFYDLFVDSTVYPFDQELDALYRTIG
jgi:hypothetical protein